MWFANVDVNDPPKRVLIPLATMDVRVRIKVGQIGPKWDKSGTFSDQISVLIPYITL